MDTIWAAVRWVGHLAWWSFGLTMWILIAGGVLMLLYGIIKAGWDRAVRRRPPQ